MKIIYLIFLSIIVFGAFRVFFIGIRIILGKFIKINDVFLKFSYPMSIFYYILYSLLFLLIVVELDKRLGFSNLEWYIMSTIIGVYSILWCYFKWELKIKALPKFSDDDKEIALKKITIFSMVMFATLLFGYDQIEKNINGKEIDKAIMIIYLTVISGIIAFDRILGQIQILYRKEKESKIIIANH